MTSSSTLSATNAAPSFYPASDAVDQAFATAASATDSRLPRLAAADCAGQALAAAEAAAQWEEFAAPPPLFATSDHFKSVPASVDAFDERLRTSLDDLVAHMDKLVLRRIQVVHRVGRVFFPAESARADAVKQYLSSRGVKDSIHVMAEYSFHIPHDTPDKGSASAVEVRVAGMLPQPPRRDPTLSSLPPILLRAMPEEADAFDEDINRRLDHAVRDFRDSKVSRVEVSIVSPMIEEDSASLAYLGKAYLVTAQLVKDAIIARGQDPASVFVKPLVNLRMVRSREPASSSYGVLVEAWSSRPDSVTRLAWAEGYVPDLRA